jgi:F0F1-type ATP synthase delta subunit
MYSEILRRLRTKEEVNELKDEINLLIRSLYETKDGNLADTLKYQIRSWVAVHVIDAFSKEGLDREKYLRDLLLLLDSFEQVELVIAFEPTEEHLDVFNAWVKENIGENVLLKLTFNPEILGGAIVISKGEYRDLSLKRVFETELESNRKKIMAMLTR